MANAWEAAPLVSSSQQPAWAAAPVLNASSAPSGGILDSLKQGVGNLAAGAIRGAGSIGATLLAPVDAAARAVGVQNDYIGRTDRRDSMDAGLQQLGAQPDSLLYKTGKLGGELAGTAGAGGAAANILGRTALATAAPGAINALRTAGMSAGSGAVIPNALARISGGAANGALSAGLVNPDDAAAGGVIGAALPGVAKVAGLAGQAVGSAIRGGGVSSEVRALANRAQELGIDIPADRLVDSKPLNAVVAGLNYVPMSGRQATETKLNDQLQQATSRLVGQDTPNMTKALRDASVDLGAKFDTTLRNTGVVVDPQFLHESTDVLNAAQKELGSDAFKPIANQFNELLDKGANGTIDGQAAYNIKRNLDRIGSGNGPEAYHALQLKGTLMGALDRSLGPQEASAFAQTREQYGNMLALEKLAKNGAEGDISIARLANLKNINNQPLQEIADIAAQFVKPREGMHGAAQRAGVGAGLATLGGIPALAGGMAAGRAANAALNSNALRNALLNQGASGAASPINQLAYRSAPILGAGQ